MKLKSAVLTLCLLSIIPASNAKPQVLVTVPSLLKGGETEKACLTANQHTAPMDVQVFLEVGEKNITVIDDQVPLGDCFKTYDFQVPEMKESTPAFLSVSAVSDGYNYTARRSVVIAATNNVVILRTDKEQYKGGQTVRIYAMAVDNNLRPVDETLRAVYVMDPKGNRMNQWLEQSTKGAFLILNFTMLDDAELGNYQIVAERQSGSPVTKNIKVAPYVLPKYTVMVKTPSQVTILDKNVTVDVSVRYTYDQGVPGDVTVRMCRPPANYYIRNSCNRNPDGICVTVTGKTDLEGKFKGNVDLSSYQLDRSGLQMSFNMQVTVTEQGTNVQMTETRYISITSQLSRVSFDYNVMLPHFKRRIPYPVAATVEDAAGEPLSDQVVELQVNGKGVVKLTSDTNGRVEHELDTSDFETSSVSLQLVYKTQEPCYDSNWIVPTYSNAYYSITRFFSSTGSFIQLQGPREELQCGKSYNILCRYVFGEGALPEGQSTVKISYIVMSRSKIMESGEHSVDVSSSRQGEFNLTYTASANHAPMVQYIAQYLMKDEVVADVINLNLENCFQNEVSANFSADSGTPGSKVDLAVTATPESTCLCRVFDQSLLLLDAGQTFSAATVYNSLQFLRLYGYSAAGFNVAPPDPACIDINKQILINGIYWQAVNNLQEPDTAKVFSDYGLHAITGALYQQPRLCAQPFSFGPVDSQPFSFGRPAPMFLANVESPEALARTEETTSTATASAAPIATRRYSFPELWFFGDRSVGQNGSFLLPLEIPGTITKWRGDVVCLSNKTGFGMTKNPANFTSFQKMFVDTSLPDSIIRGEIMHVVGSVANYMEKCAKVRVSLEPSTDYQATPLDAGPVKCVCSQERVSFSWKINATIIGLCNVAVTAETIHIGDTCDGPADPNEPNRKDTVEKTFNVEPEGIKYEVTKTDFVCTKGANSAVQVSINPTGRIVPGSMRAKIQMTGEILGRALTKPEALITEPAGCGEQNLVKLLPIVSAVKLLNLTGRLTEEMRARAVQYMTIGYMRQLQYRHSDGSFSAFGQGRSQSSAWLTVLSMKAISEVSEFTYVDPNIIKQGTVYMEKLQVLPSGYFKAVGNLFNNGLKGGAEDDVSFTCAVVSVLAQTTYSTTPSLLRPALAYLDEASRRNQSVYNYAMLFYVYRVVKNDERANTIYGILNTLAIDDGESRYWRRPVQPPQKTPYLFAPQSSSSDLEITATVLKALAYGETSSTVSAEKLNEMAKISTYLAKSQNIHGSYRTTSDTVAVAEALSLYGGIVYQKDATNTVQLKSGGQVLKEFNIDPANRILLQSEALPQVPGDYSVEVSGNGCVLVQAGVQFHVPLTQENAAFSLSMTTFPEDCKNGVAYMVNIQVNCSYHGIQNKSNMALIKIPLMSGYTMDYDSLVKLQSKYPKAEEKNGDLVVYFNEITSEGVSFNVTQSMGRAVYNFQERTAVVYDMYETDENAFAALYHPCTPSA